MSTENHINESILSDEIKEHQKKNRIDHMKYMPDMEVLESDILDKVLNYVENYNYETYTEADVKRALSHERKTPEDFAALLSLAALPLLEEIAQCAKVEKERYLVIPWLCLPLFILQITVKITVYTADLTAIIR